MKYARKENLPRIPTYLLDYSLQNLFLCLNQVYFPEVWHAPLAPLQIVGFLFAGSISKLVNAEKNFIDGTFKVCPVPFMQLLIISTMHGAEDKCKIIPRLYVLLPSKSEHCYCAFFTYSTCCLTITIYLVRMFGGTILVWTLKLV